MGGPGPAHAEQGQRGHGAGQGQVGEQADGYLGLVGSAPAALRAQVDAVNIKRRAYYTGVPPSRWRQTPSGSR